MFETATLSYGPSTKRVWTTAMGFTGQALLVACALLAPIISPQVLPRVAWMTSIAPPGAPPPPPPPAGQAVPRSHTPVSQVINGRLYIPRVIPAAPLILTEQEPPLYGGTVGTQIGVVGGQDGGDPNGIIGGLLQAAGRIVPVVKPPEPAKHEVPASAPTYVAPPRITQLRMATPIHKVEPIYPALARQAHISGVVELLGVLGTDGRIHEIKVLRGHPLLVKAAVDAVQQWIFQPTLLNGQAVEVSAPITVTFILNQ